MENIYNHSKIYRIVCNTTGKTYYGSTCEPTLARRLVKHRCDYKKWKEDNTKRYMSSFDVFENNNYEIILCESVKCESKDELRMCERKWIEENECVNRYRPIITKEEDKARDKARYENNKEAILQQHHEWKEKNKEHIKEKTKAYNDSRVDIRREHYEQNKEAILARQKEYCEKNKEKIKERNSIKTICECGCEVRKRGLWRHVKSKTHTDLLAKQISP